MNIDKDKVLIFRIIEYGLQNQYFTLSDLFNGLNVNNEDREFIINTLTSYSKTSSNINHVITLVDATGKSSWHRTYSLLPNAIVQYVDFIEIVEARKTATDANRNAMMAVNVSVYAILIGLVIGLGQIFFQIFSITFGR